MIVVVDAGMGNLRSVVRALEYSANEITANGPTPQIVISTDPDVIRSASRVVVPGQGAFRDCATALAANGGALSQAVTEAIREGKPYLGICLGMQVLFGTSDEAPGCSGLGVLRGHVARFRDGVRGDDGEICKIPHVGWNRAYCVNDRWRSIVGTDDWYYFVHSYYVVPDDASIVVAKTNHGEQFTSAIARDNVFAVQFHPEKSQRAGLTLLARWLRGTR